MKISAIVACGLNNVIGVDNGLPWRLPKDLKWFKSKTIGHHVIIGRKSFETLPGPLVGRTNIIVTRDESYYRSSCIIAHSIDDALRFAFDRGEEEVFILGGGIIYKQTIPLWDRLYLTEVQASPEGDTYFPLVNLESFQLVFHEAHATDNKHRYAFTFKIYEREPGVLPQ